MVGAFVVYYCFTGFFAGIVRGFEVCPYLVECEPGWFELFRVRREGPG